MLVVVLTVVGIVGVAPTVSEAQTKKDVDNAQDAQERAYQELLDANQAVGQAISDLEAIEGELAELNYTIARLDRKITEFDDQVAELKANVRELVVEAYTNSNAGLVSAAFSAASIQDLLTSQSLIGQAADRDLASLDLLTAVNRENDRLKVEIAEKRTEVEALEQQQTALVDRLSKERERADHLYAEAQDKYKDAVVRYEAELKRQAEEAARKRREAAKRAAEEAARQKAAKNTAAATKSTAAAASNSAAAGLPAANTPGLVCPVAGNSWFIDTWGASRSGGTRTHKGVDMIASRGTPLVAMNAGKIRMNWNALGGRQIYIYAVDGNFYYYAHLSGYASGLRNGQTVSKGQLIGYVGSTGNATTNVLHLGMGPRSGVYVNPYPTVRRIC